MEMRAISFLVCGSMIAAAGLPQGVPRAVGAAPFTLTVDAKPIWDGPSSAFTATGDHEFKAGERVQVVIVTKNTSEHDMSISAMRDGAFYFYQYDIRDSEGKVIQRRERTGPMTLSGAIGIVLKPGESHADASYISGTYDLRKPGSYTIQVSRPISGKPEAPVIKSNVLTITVLPPDQTEGAPR